MKRKLIYRLASLGLAISCAFVSIPIEGLSGVLTVYAEEVTEPVEPMEETTEMVEPLAETEEPTQEVDDVYLDETNGVSYYYYGYSDGTATIYNMTFSNGAILEFPTTINSYAVTKISGSSIASATNRLEVSAMTIPESITYIGESIFTYLDIGTLFYNTNATNSGYAMGEIFVNSTISNLVIGNNVEYIDTWTFDGAKFLFDELTVSVKTIGKHAFCGVWDENNPGTLTITDMVETIQINAFALNHFATVNYNGVAATDAWSNQQGAFYHSYISALNLGETATHIGAYMFAGAYASFSELTVDVPSIGEKAFAEMWQGEQKAILTLTENVTYIEDGAFMLNNFATVNYNCNAETKEEYGMAGMFYHSNIDNLVIASNVTTIPHYTFNESYFNFNTFTIDVERIGKRAFGYLWAEQEAGTLTLTENVKYIYPTAFGYGNYVKVNYNADADGESGYDTESIFYKSNIGDLAIGSNVTKLPAWTFYKSVFGCNEVTVNVETIGEYAFGHMWADKTAGRLNIGERGSYIYPSAFAYGNFEVVNYKANADGESSYNTEAIFYQANVGELNIDETVTKLPGWLFYYTYFGCDEITVNVETIGEKAFGFIWSTSEAGTLNLGDRVSYIYPGAFSNGNYKVVNYNANADGQSKNSSDSIFGSSKIAELNIGDNVTKVPNYLFYKAVFMFQELTVDIENIGACAFGYAWTNDYPARLTIGSRVGQVKEQAFVSNVIEDLNYNANATVEASSYGPFYLSTISSLDIGENVELIGKALFYNSNILDTDITVNAKTIESNAFANAWKSGNPVNLTIGEKAEIINSRAFASNYINKLQYNAKNAAPTTSASGYNGAFNGDTITELALGDTVEKIQAYTFYGIKLTQEDLKIPNSVTFMGKSVFNNSNLNITNLYIGSGLEELKSDTFGQGLVLSNIYVDVLTGNDTYKGTSLATNAIKNHLPVAENVYIHINSDFYYYFTAKATNVISSCVDHMKETIGEEYLDEATAQYITPTYDTCEICKYQTTAFAYEDAYVVRFYVDGILYHTAYTKNGGSVDAPIEPEKTGYNFKGWDAEFSNVTENIDVNAVFEAVKHTVTFKDHDGTVIETQTIEHGSPAFEPIEPTRAGHTFTGWDKSFDNITADTEITALYDVNYYNVVFKDNDGTKLSEQTVAYGSGATAPENPTREGYNFTGWDTDFSNITGDTTVTAKYRIKIFSVIFKVFNDIFSSQEVEYGDSATNPGEPTSIVENWGRWIFAGWDNTWDYITDNLIINAIMEQEYNTYTVTFLNADGSVIDTQMVKYGDYAVVPEDPVREGHTFTGWGGGNINLPIAEDMTFRAVYEPIYYTATFVDEEGTVLNEVTFGYFAGPNILFSVEQKEGHTVMWKPSVEVPGYEYLTSNMVTTCQFKEDVTLTLYYKPDVFSIQFLDWDGTILKEETVEYGKSATPPEEPIRKGYTFKEWGDGSYDFINAGVGFIAQYDINYYTVTFVDYDGTVLSTQEIHYQGSANAPDDPVREGCDFIGWDADYTNIEEDITITAQYNTNKYTVRFEDYDGTELGVKEVEHGNAVVPPETPTREGYTFRGWDKSTDNITGNTVITATYEINKYTVTFVDYNGSAINTQTVTHGSDATAPENPVREGYDFIGWDKAYTNITADTEVTAVYEIKVFTVVFKDNDTIISTQQIEYGKDATEPEVPSREDEEWGIWVFKEWDNTWTDIKENREINAIFEKKYNQYTVTFVDYDESILKTQTVFHGNAATAPENPTREGHTFKEWDKDYNKVVGNMMITAVYEANSYTVTFVDYDGSVIDTQTVKYQESAVLPKNPLRLGYTFKEWVGTWENITRNCTVTATYDINIYTVDFVDHDGTLIDSQSVEFGIGATAPENPTREGHTFKGWDKDYSKIVGNLTITAVYEANWYTVTFVDYDGSVIDTQTVKYQEIATLPKNPTRVGYTFKEWQGVWENITEDSTVTATYDINVYKVDFVDHDGIIIDSQFIEYGKGATAPESPTRDGYTFINWDKDFSKITENLIITAVYEKNHVHEYTEETERKDATCIEKGYVISKCSCGDTEKKELDVDSDNHVGETEVKDEKAATCTEKGYTGDTYCKSCEVKISDGSEIDLEEHTPGETKVENRVEPTTETKGSYDEVIYCEICSKELSRTQKEIPMLEPDEPNDSEEEDNSEEEDEPEDFEEPSEPDEPEDSEEPSEPDEPEDSEEPSEPDEPEDSEEPTETESEPEEPSESEEPTEPVHDEEEGSIEDIVIPIVAATGVTGGSTILAIVYWRRRRKIYGNLLDKQGNPIANAKVYLEGKDVLETLTDENGYFEFKNLKTGLYKFMLCNDLDVLLVEAELYTDEKNVEEVVTIIESKCEVEFEKEHKNISFIIII